MIRALYAIGFFFEKRTKRVYRSPNIMKNRSANHSAKCDDPEFITTIVFR